MRLLSTKIEMLSSIYRSSASREMQKTWNSKFLWKTRRVNRLKSLIRLFCAVGWSSKLWHPYLKELRRSKTKPSTLKGSKCWWSCAVDIWKHFQGYERIGCWNGKQRHGYPRPNSSGRSQDSKENHFHSAMSSTELTSFLESASECLSTSLSIVKRMSLNSLLASNSVPESLALRLYNRTILQKIVQTWSILASSSCSLTRQSPTRHLWQSGLKSVSRRNGLCSWPASLYWWKNPPSCLRAHHSPLTQSFSAPYMNRTFAHHWFRYCRFHGPDSAGTKVLISRSSSCTIALEYFSFELCRFSRICKPRCIDRWSDYGHRSRCYVYWSDLERHLRALHK